MMSPAELQRAVAELMMSPTQSEALAAWYDAADEKEQDLAGTAARYAFALAQHIDKEDLRGPLESYAALLVSLLAYADQAPWRVTSATQREIDDRIRSLLDRADTENQRVQLQANFDDMRRFSLHTAWRLCNLIDYTNRSATFHRATQVYQNPGIGAFCRTEEDIKTGLATGGVDLIGSIDAGSVTFRCDQARRAVMEAIGLSIRLVLGEPITKQLVAVH